MLASKKMLADLLQKWHWRLLRLMLLLLLLRRLLRRLLLQLRPRLRLLLLLERFRMTNPR